jgi:hypothetical protein
MDIVISVLETNGYELFDTDSDADESSVVGFGIKNHNGGFCPARIEYINELDVFKLSVQLSENVIQPILYEGVFQIFNSLHHQMPGVVFTLELDIENGDKVEMSIMLFAVDSKLPEQGVEKLLAYAQNALLVCLPVLYSYISQRLVYNVNTKGQVLGVRTTVTEEDCMELLKIGSYGRA